MKKPIALALCAAVVATGCATAPAYQWTHPALAGNANANDLATLAQAECDAYAAGRAPAPRAPIYMPVPQPSSYSTTGTINTYGSTGYYNATTTSRGNFGTGLAQGMNNGAAIGAAIAQSQAEERARNVSAACMRTNGWIDASTDEDKLRLQQAIKPVSAPASDAANPFDQFDAK